MSKDIERRIIDLLKGGHALSESGRRAIINQLTDEERQTLSQIAMGGISVPHSKLRSKAIIALAFDDTNPEETLKTLLSILKTDDPSVQVRALRSLERLNAVAVTQEVQELINNPTTRVDVALAAARVAAKVGGEEVAENLRTLRERLLTMVENPTSPSIESLNRLIDQAKKRGRYPSDDEQPIV